MMLASPTSTSVSLFGGLASPRSGGARAPRKSILKELTAALVIEELDTLARIAEEEDARNSGNLEQALDTIEESSRSVTGSGSHEHLDAEDRPARRSSVSTVGGRERIASADEQSSQGGECSPGNDDGDSGEQLKHIRSDNEQVTHQADTLESKTAESDPLEPNTGEEAIALARKTLGESEKYAIYFKMLRMGVPPPAVKNKMVQKRANPDILDLGEDAPMSKVTPLERAYEVQLNQVKAPKRAGEILHWEAISSDRLDGRETVFIGGDFALEANTLDQIQDLLGLFQRLPVSREAEKNAKVSTSRWKKERIESVLDSRRAQAISIAMKKLRIAPDQPAKFTWALREMNENVLNAQAMEVLLSCPLWPISEDEHSLLKARSNTGARLAEPDRLVLFVIETVPDVVARVNAMAFRWEFELSVAEATKTAAEITAASKAVLTNNNLKLVLRAAILFGNAVNAESGNPIQGCTLQSLNKLAVTRSVRDKKVTALDCVAGYCMRCYPDFSSLADLNPHVSIARKAELETHIAALIDMRRGVEVIRKMRQLDSFVTDAIRRIAQLEDELKSVQDLFNETLAYFGYAKGELESHEFFELLASFIENWAKAFANRQKEAKTAAAANMAAAAAKRAAERQAQRAVEKAETERQRQEEEETNKVMIRFPVQLKSIFRSKNGDIHQAGGSTASTGEASPRGGDSSLKLSNRFLKGNASPRAKPATLETSIVATKPRRSIFQSFVGPKTSTIDQVAGARANPRRSILWG